MKGGVASLWSHDSCQQSPTIEGSGGRPCHSCMVAEPMRFPDARKHPPLKCQSSLYRSSVEQTVMIAFKAGGRRAATWRLLNPPHDFPIIPTAPLHHGCAAIHAITSTPSCSSG